MGGGGSEADDVGSVDEGVGADDGGEAEGGAEADDVVSVDEGGGADDGGGEVKGALRDLSYSEMNRINSQRISRLIQAAKEGEKSESDESDFTVIGEVESSEYGGEKDGEEGNKLVEQGEKSESEEEVGGLLADHSGDDSPGKRPVRRRHKQRFPFPKHLTFVKYQLNLYYLKGTLL